MALLALLVLAAAGGVSWLFRPVTSEADRVREVIRAVVAGAEAGDAGDVMAPLATNFAAESGGSTLDRKMVHALLAREFLRRGPLFVLIGEITVSIEGTHAEASFDAVLAENSERLTDVLPVDADAWHMDIDLERREDGDWLVSHARRSDALLLPAGAP